MQKPKSGEFSISVLHHFHTIFFCSNYFLLCKMFLKKLVLIFQKCIHTPLIKMMHLLVQWLFFPYVKGTEFYHYYVKYSLEKVQV